MRGWQYCTMALALVLAGCGSGKSGSHPEFFPEVRFVIEPLGGQEGTTFAVEYIADGDATHHFPGRTFNATNSVGFFLDNASPPYGASFRWIAGAQADIALIVSGQTIQLSRERLGPNNAGPCPEGSPEQGCVEIKTIDRDGGTFGIGSGNPEIRLEVSADPGTLFQGTVGDFYTSYDVGFTVDDDERLQARAPAYIFFENARETISAVVRNANQLSVTIDLYIDGELKDSDTANKDAIVKRDL
jgi:hypothetical protein